MISRNKGILSLEFWVPIFAIIAAALAVTLFYHFYVTPRADDFITTRRLLAAQGGNEEFMKQRPLFIIIKSREPAFEIVFCLWGLMVLGYKLGHVIRERVLFKHDLIRMQPGERII